MMLLAGSASGTPLINVVGRVLAEPGGEPQTRAVVLIDGDASPGAVEGEGPPATARLDEVWISFVPKVQVVAPGASLVMTDRDDESHTVHAWLGHETLFNRAAVPGEPAQRIVLARVGVVTITCDIHQAMRAFVLVSRARASAITAADGTFTVAVAPGRHRVRVWRDGDDDDRASPPGVEPGRDAGEFDAGAPWTIRVPPARHVSAVAAVPPPLESDPPLTISASGFKQLHTIGGWPRGAWALVLAALAMAGGVVGAFRAMRLAARRNWPLGVPVGIGVCVAGASAALIYLGLNGAVGAALGLGTLIGTAVFAAEERPARPADPTRPT